MLAVEVRQVKNDDDRGAGGKAKSGRARMAGLSKKEKRVLGQSAANSRWEKIPDGATVHEPEAWGDLPIVGHKIPCAVLVIEGEVVRVVSERGLIKSFGGKRGGSHWRRMNEDGASQDTMNLPAIISARNLRQFISDDLREALEHRYPFKI